MTDREAYTATLSRLESDLAKAEATATRLRNGITAIRDIINADDPAEAKAATNGRPAKPTGAHPATLPQTVVTMKDAATYAIYRAGKAMRIRDIYDLLLTLGYTYKGSFPQFRTSLAPTMNRSGAFDRVSAGTYTLTGDEATRAAARWG